MLTWGQGRSLIYSVFTSEKSCSDYFIANVASLIILCLCFFSCLPLENENNQMKSKCIVCIKASLPNVLCHKDCSNWLIFSCLPCSWFCDNRCLLLLVGSLFVIGWNVEVFYQKVVTCGVCFQWALWLYLKIASLRSGIKHTIFKPFCKYHFGSFCNDGLMDHSGIFGAYLTEFSFGHTPCFIHWSNHFWTMTLLCVYGTEGFVFV